VRMLFTYEGILYEEMLDRIQWDGQITPLLLNDGMAMRSERVVNPSGAQVFRSYPSLEEPERIASQAQVIQTGANAYPASASCGWGGSRGAALAPRRRPVLVTSGAPRVQS
jgi:hypothetical protein